MESVDQTQQGSALVTTFSQKFLGMEPLTPLGAAILSVAMLAILLLPRRWAPVPMLVVTCYMTPSVGVVLGALNFFSIRFVILAGVIRIILRREYRGFLRSSMDRVMILWSIWALVVSAFRGDPAATLIFNGGQVFNYLGIYFILRSLCKSMDDVLFLCRVGSWLLVPIAFEMVYEKVTSSNLFSTLGGVSQFPEIREGRIRAQGPFAHSIMAGTVGAVMLPLCIGIWRRYRSAALVGILASITMVVSSASSGPLMSAMFALLGLLFWSVRRFLPTVRWTIVFIYFILMIFMNTPPYYLIGRIDLAGGSTGWHRARLIESSIEHLNEWWFAGTDYTRHWMPTGVQWSSNHSDITNQYILFGVHGGLLLMFLFILLLVIGFRNVGRSVRLAQKSDPDHAFFCWALGASLFVQAATFVSVAYIDQSFVFLFVTLAAIAGANASVLVNSAHPTVSRFLDRRVLVVQRTSSSFLA